MNNEIDFEFLSENDKNNLYKNVVLKTFPKLKNEHIAYLLHRLILLIQYIASCFNFYSDIENFKLKLEQNNYKDSRWLLLSLLPFIDTDIKGYGELSDLNDLYTMTIDDDLSSNIDGNYSPRIIDIINNDKKQHSLTTQEFQ